MVNAPWLNCGEYCDFAGGHINPAVTLGFFIAGRISFLRGLLYTIMQVLGAAVGAALIRAVGPLPSPAG